MRREFEEEQAKKKAKEEAVSRNIINRLSDLTNLKNTHFSIEK